MSSPGRAESTALLEELVSIRSLSGAESDASEFLAQWLGEHGLERCRVDEVGNAVGELGEPEAAKTVVLLGHIDTVPGDVPVERRSSKEGEVLYGRGSVDAKGPLAAFCAASARLGSDWAREREVRVLVVGAVEEEAATSRGARHLRDLLLAQGGAPDACVIGEPSGWNRVTLGYKGRLLIDLEAERPMTHTAGPDPGITTVAIEMWNAVREFCESFNQGLDRAFDQLLPSLRSIDTSGDGLRERVRATCGIRLPLSFEPADLVRSLETGLARRIGTDPPSPSVLNLGSSTLSRRMEGPGGTVALTYRGFEPAWRGERRSTLVTGFRGAIRHIGGNDRRPGIVVKTGTSDMNVVGPSWRCPILAYGAGDSSLDHTPEEHVVLEEWWKAVLVVEEALRRWAGVPDAGGSR